LAALLLGGLDEGVAAPLDVLLGRLELLLGGLEVPAGLAVGGAGLDGRLGVVDGLGQLVLGTAVDLASRRRGLGVRDRGVLGRGRRRFGGLVLGGRPVRRLGGLLGRRGRRGV